MLNISLYASLWASGAARREIGVSSSAPLAVAGLEHSVHWLGSSSTAHCALVALRGASRFITNPNPVPPVPEDEPLRAPVCSKSEEARAPRLLPPPTPAFRIPWSPDFATGDHTNGGSIGFPEALRCSAGFSLQLYAPPSRGFGSTTAPWPSLSGPGSFGWLWRHDGGGVPYNVAVKPRRNTAQCVERERGRTMCCRGSLFFWVGSQSCLIGRSFPT